MFKMIPDRIETLFASKSHDLNAICNEIMTAGRRQ